MLIFNWLVLNENRGLILIQGSILDHGGKFYFIQGSIIEILVYSEIIILIRINLTHIIVEILL